MSSREYMTGKVKISRPGRNTYANKEDLPNLLEQGWRLGWGPKQPDILCSRCGKPIYRYGNTTGLCKECMKATNYMKRKWEDDEYRNKVITGMSKPRGPEFAKAQSARLKQHYQDHPERRLQQGKMFSDAWKAGSHGPDTINRSQAEDMMYQAFVNLFGEEYVSRDPVQGPDMRWCYPDVLLFDEIVIEYYGDYYHGNPKYYDSDDIVSHGRKASDVWAYDKDRVDRVFKSVPNGYVSPEERCPILEVIIIWESDVANLKTQQDWNEYVFNRFCGYDEVLSV